MNIALKASHFIDGAYIEDEAGAAFDLIYPASGRKRAHIHFATPDLIEKALAAAKRAQPAWAALRPVERGRILRRAETLLRARAEELAQIETLETGRAISETRYDAIAVADALEFYAGAIATLTSDNIDLGGNFALTLREPLGVCIGIGAWNYPLESVGWKSITALAMGNAMVFKPSEMTPQSALIIAEIYQQAGVPDGIFSVVQGGGAVGEALVSDPRSAKVSLTGSVDTGKKVMGLAGSLMKQGTMELGGKSPLIIFDDAEIENAVNGILMANFYSTGQICTNGTRVYLHDSLYDTIVERLIQRVQAIRIGDPMDPNTNMGPLVSAAQQARVLSLIEIGKSEGGRILCGGVCPEVAGFENGFWIEPTIFSDMRDDMTLAQTEIFGPVLSLFRFSDEAEVLARANASRFGLASGIFTRDLSRAHRCARALESGRVWVNCYNISPIDVPFGGIKESGIGRECALAVLDHYTQVKSVVFEMGQVDSVF